MFKQAWFVSFITLCLLAGVVLASDNGLAFSRSWSDAGAKQCYPQPIKGVPIEVTGVNWHVKSSDYRYVDQAILSLQSTDGKRHRVYLYLTLADYDGRVLYQGKRLLMVNPYIETVAYLIEDVAAADAAKLRLTALPVAGGRR